MGQPTMRDPKHPHWPDAGERTHMQEVAERWKWAYADLADRRHLTRTIGKANHVKLGRALDDYLAHRERVVEPRTFAGDRSALGHLRETFGARHELYAVEPQQMVNALLDQGYKPSTVKQYVVSLRAFWKWAGLPFPAVTIPKPGKGDVRYWTPEQVARLRAFAPKVDPQLLIALDCTLYMGLRVAEVFGLMWEDIADTTVRVQRQIPQGRKEPKPLKGKRARTSFILPGWDHARGSGYLVHLDGLPIGRRVQWRWMRELLDGTGLNHMGAGWHMGRHTYAKTALVDHGISLEQLQQFLGHSSIRTTETSYGHLTPDAAAIMARRTVYGV